MQQADKAFICNVQEKRMNTNMAKWMETPPATKRELMVQTWKLYFASDYLIAILVPTKLYSVVFVCVCVCVCVH